MTGWALTPLETRQTNVWQFTVALARTLPYKLSHLFFQSSRGGHRSPPL